MSSLRIVFAVLLLSLAGCASIATRVVQPVASPPHFGRRLAIVVDHAGPATAAEKDELARAIARRLAKRRSFVRVRIGAANEAASDLVLRVRIADIERVDLWRRLISAGFDDERAQVSVAADLEDARLARTLGRVEVTGTSGAGGLLWFLATAAAGAPLVGTTSGALDATAAALARFAAPG